jgi:hypothetical protein
MHIVAASSNQDFRVEGFCCREFDLNRVKLTRPTNPDRS